MSPPEEQHVRALPRRPPWNSLEFTAWGDDVEHSLATLLWQRARDVRLWSESSPDLRNGLFHVAMPRPTVEFPEALTAPLGILSNMVEAPGAAVPASIADACRAIFEWAESKGHFWISLNYADAWAFVEERTARACAEAGHCCIRAAQWGRAEEWLMRGAVHGKRLKDWEWYIRAYLRRGILRYELGDYRRARRYALSAGRKAAWSGHDKLEGMAYHDLLAVAIHTGSFRQGERYTGLALQKYPVRFDRARHLTHDFSLFLARRACFSLALPVLRPLERLFPPGDPMRVLWLATTAEVAAGVNDQPLFESLAAEVDQAVQRSEEQAAIALLRVASGYRRFDAWADAETLAARSLAIALRRNEGEPQRGAYQLLDDISLRRRGPADSPPPGEARTKDLIGALYARLSKQHRLGVLPYAVELTF